MSEAAVTGMAVQQVPVAGVVVSRFQRRKRFAEADLEGLAESVKVHGVIQPVVMRMQPEAPEQYELVAGERRWRAAKLAGLATVPAIVRELTDREACEFCLLENLQREDLTVIEEAQSLDDLVRMGLEVQEVAARIGKGRKYVSRRRRLLELDEGVQKAMEEGRMSIHAAQKLLEVAEEKRPEAVEALVRLGLDSGELTERSALSLLDHNFVKPARRARAWEEAREAVLAELPGAEWCGYEEALARGEWVSGFLPVERQPELWRVADGISMEHVPSWGELAEKHGLAVKLGLQDYEGEDEELRVREREGEGFVAPGSFWVVGFVEVQTLIDAETAAAEQEGEPCIFKVKGQARSAGEEQQRGAAEDAAKQRARVHARREEVLKLLRRVMRWELDAEMQEKLVEWIFEDQACDGLQDVLEAMEGEPESGEEEKWFEDAKARVVEQMGNRGGFAVLGMLEVGAEIERSWRWMLPTFREWKLIDPEGYPELCAMLEEGEQADI